MWSRKLWWGAILCIRHVKMQTMYKIMQKGNAYTYRKSKNQYAASNSALLTAAAVSEQTFQKTKSGNDLMATELFQLFNHTFSTIYQHPMKPCLSQFQCVAKPPALRHHKNKAHKLPRGKLRIRNILQNFKKLGR